MPLKNGPNGVKRHYSAFPGETLAVNGKYFDPKIGDKREIDIFTQTCVVEVKGGVVSHKAGQFLGQMAFSEARGRKHIVFAPGITKARYLAYTKQGIIIARDKAELVQLIREARHEKHRHTDK